MEMWLYPSKKQHFLNVLVAKMANNQLRPCTFSMAECLQGWAFTPVTRHPLQDLGPTYRGGPIPRTSLTCIDSLNGGVICQVRNLVACTPAKICLACFCLRESCLQPYWVLTSCINSLPLTCVDKT